MDDFNQTLVGSRAILIDRGFLRTETDLLLLFIIMFGELLNDTFKILIRTYLVRQLHILFIHINILFLLENHFSEFCLDITSLETYLCSLHLR